MSNKPTLHKTLKVSADTHHAIKLLAAQRGVSMAQLLDNLIQHSSNYDEDNGEKMATAKKPTVTADMNAYPAKPMSAAAYRQLVLAALQEVELSLDLFKQFMRIAPQEIE